MLSIFSLPSGELFDHFLNLNEVERREEDLTVGHLNGQRGREKESVNNIDELGV